MDPDDQRALAVRVLKALRARGVEALLVGSSAVVALDLMPRASKDVDVVPFIDGGLDEARQLAAGLAEDLGGEVAEVGWGVVGVVGRSPDGDTDWRVDLLAPGAGPFPVATADLLRRHAKDTEAGPAACPEHVLVMKAVGWADSYGRGHRSGMDRYGADVVGLAEVLDAVDWALVEDLLATFQDARAGPAARKIDEVFGTDLGGPAGPDAA